MKDLDQKIREALKDTGVDPPDFEAEESLRAQVVASFQGKARWQTILVSIYQFLFFGLTIFAAVRFFQVESTRDLIFYAAVFLASLWVLMALKIWFWMLLNKNSVTREVKRVELQIAALARRISDSPGPGPPR